MKNVLSTFRSKTGKKKDGKLGERRGLEEGVDGSKAGSELNSDGSVRSFYRPSDGSGEK